MVGFAHPIVELTVLGLYVVVGAIALTVTQAWAMAQTRGEPPEDALRYALAWIVSSATLALPPLLLIGPEGLFTPAKEDRTVTTIVLAALTAAAAIATARRRRPWRTLEGLGFVARAERLFPVHLAAVVIFGAIDLVLFGLLIISAIH